MVKLSKNQLRKISKSWFFRFIVIFVAVGILAYTWQRFSQSPVNGVISSSSQVSQSNIKPKTVGLTNYTDKLLSFNYPDNYNEAKSNTVVGNTVEQFGFDAVIGIANTRRLAVSVKTDPANMKDDSAYTFRRLESSGYSSESLTINDIKIEKLTKKSGGEIAYFLPGDKYYAIIVISSTRLQDDFDSDAQVVLKSLYWL